MPFSPAALPLPLTTLFAKAMPLPADVPTVAARMPSSPPFLTYMRERDTDPLTFDRSIPAPVEVWMTPPVQPLWSAAVHVPEPLLVTLRPPEPTVLRTMPLVAPVELIRWNVALLAVKSVFDTVSAPPLPESI